MAVSMRKLTGLSKAIVDDRGRDYKLRDGDDVVSCTVGMAFYNLCCYGRPQSRSESRKRRDLGRHFAGGDDSVILSKDELERLGKLVDGNDTQQPVIVIDHLDDCINGVEVVQMAEKADNSSKEPALPAGVPVAGLEGAPAPSDPED